MDKTGKLPGVGNSLIDEAFGHLQRIHGMISPMEEIFERNRNDLVHLPIEPRLPAMGHPSDQREDNPRPMSQAIGRQRSQKFYVEGTQSQLFPALPKRIAEQEEKFPVDPFPSTSGHHEARAADSGEESDLKEFSQKPIHARMNPAARSAEIARLLDILGPFAEE